MKPTPKANPTKQEILSWLHSVLPASAPRPASIEEMGNGAAYLHLLQTLRPGSIRPEKINNSPSTAYEIINNLKLLSVAFGKLQLPYTIEIDKLAQMKYQDNYHLASYLYKLDKVELQNKEPNVVEAKKELKPSRVKVIVGKQSQSILLKKQPPPMIDKSTFQKLKEQPQHPLQKIEIDPPVTIDQTKSQKLDKIAQVLHLQRREKTQKPKSYQPPNPPKPIQLYPNTIQQAYKRFLRPSICQRSKYLNDYTLNNKTTADPQQPASTAEDQTHPDNHTHRLMTMIQCSKQEEEDERDKMLLSQTKQPEQNVESEGMRKSINLLQQIQKEKEEYRQGKVEEV